MIFLLHYITTEDKNHRRISAAYHFWKTVKKSGTERKVSHFLYLSAIFSIFHVCFRSLSHNLYLLSSFSIRWQKISWEVCSEYFEACAIQKKIQISSWSFCFVIRILLLWRVPMFSRYFINWKSFSIFVLVLRWRFAVHKSISMMSVDFRSQCFYPPSFLLFLALFCVKKVLETIIHLTFSSIKRIFLKRIRITMVVFLVNLIKMLIMFSRAIFPTKYEWLISNLSSSDIWNFWNVD